MADLFSCSLLFMVPVACSLFPQRCSMSVSSLEPELQDSIVSQYGDKIRYVYFNKGLLNSVLFHILKQDCLQKS
ncbi:hypothetical protein XELAEV_18001765mg [Xenopus laevis]|uniref:Uncharacterized protein n=1 Tax=Xenopus laevis TaxID=8355 RepID=A0A974BQ57_XENLA|nr:hypothetical protein XELAEV_18001765mg [Xenopus laevis]